MTEKERLTLHDVGNMKLMNLYMDECTKTEAQLKLEQMQLGSRAFSSMMRVMVRYFIDHDIPGIKEQIEREAVYTATKNKRSKL